MAAASRALRVALLLPLPALLGLTVTLSGLAAGGWKVGLFLNSTAGVSAHYRTDLTPAAWAFSVWGLIFVMQLLIVAYLMAALFRRTPSGALLFHLDVFSATVLGAYGLSFALNILWLFLFDRAIAHANRLIESALVQWLLFGSLAVATGLCLSKFEGSRRAVQDVCSGPEVWLHLILIQNGLALYAAWTAVTAPLNTAMALVHAHEMAMAGLGWGPLTVLAVETVIYTAADFLLMDRWTRYLLAPHGVLVWALAAVVCRNFIHGSANPAVTEGLLAAAVLVLMAKVCCCCVRHRRDPAKMGYENLPGSIKDDQRRQKACMSPAANRV